MIWNWGRFLMHVPAGLIAPLLVLTHNRWGGIFCIIFIATFLIYEVVEGGDPHIDIQGMIAGIPIGALIVWMVTRRWK